jgi:hypothetical protein
MKTPTLTATGQSKNPLLWATVRGSPPLAHFVSSSKASPTFAGATGGA